MQYTDLSDDALEHEIATLSALIQAATFRLLCLVAELDRRGLWADPLDSNGFRSAAHWLAWRTGLSLGVARQYVRVARALPELPRLSVAFSRGEVSYSKVRAITRVATPDNEETWLGMARTASAAQLERVVRQYRRASAQQEREQAQDQQLHRSLVTYFDTDGMLVVQGRLAPEQGAALLKALEQATDPDPEATAEQVKADALARVAERSLQRGSAEPSSVNHVVVHVDAEVLADPEADGRCELQDGPRLAPDVARRLACDCTRSEMAHGPDGHLEPGRKSRVVSATLRRALQARDGTRCTFPGCSCRARDAHHLQHWADGGPTVLENLVGLCRAHHTFVHEQGWSVELVAGGGFRFSKPDGTELSAAPPMPAVPRGSAEPSLIEWLPPQTVLSEVSARPELEVAPPDYDWAVESVLQTRPEINSA